MFTHTCFMMLKVAFRQKGNCLKYKLHVTFQALILYSLTMRNNKRISNTFLLYMIQPFFVCSPVFFCFLLLKKAWLLSLKSFQPLEYGRLKQQWEIPRKDVRCTERIAKGSFVEVWQGKMRKYPRRNDIMKVAVKKIIGRALVTNLNWLLTVISVISPFMCSHYFHKLKMQKSKYHSNHVFYIPKGYMKLMTGRLFKVHFSSPSYWIVKQLVKDDLYSCIIV